MEADGIMNVYRLVVNPDHFRKGKEGLRLLYAPALTTLAASRLP
jgi:hypothetical protein